MAKLLTISNMLTLPKSFTEEEKFLSSKYAILRKLKQRLNGHKPPLLESVDNEIQKIHRGSKNVAVQILKEKGGLKNSIDRERSTQNFKKPSSQSKETQAELKRCAKYEYFPEASGQTRSVAIRGNNITQQLLRQLFSNIGDIWNIRISDTGHSAIVSFKSPESVNKAAKMNGVIVGKAQQLFVNPTKKSNECWNGVITEDRKISVDNHLLLKKRTVHAAYDGLLRARDLRCFFQTVGAVETVYVSKSKKSSAFVTFMFEEDAEKATKELNGTIWKGKKFTVSLQKISRNDNLGSSLGVPEDISRKLVVYDE